MANERSRDFGGGPSQGAEQGGAGRDPGAEALLELARMIGGQGDPFAPQAVGAAGARASEPRMSESRMSEPRMSEPRLGDVSRMAAQEPPYNDRYDAGRVAPRGSGRCGFDFPAPDRAGDFDADHVPFRRRDEDYADEYAGGVDYGDEEPVDDDEGGTKRRRPGRMILSVLALAVFGTVAAYGYRYVVAAIPSGPTPVIRADNSPTRITPMSDVRQDGGRDRVGEQLVRRDEDPVEVGGASDAVPPGDPKRVHTVPIRADQGTAASQARAAAAPRQAPSPQPAAQPAPPPQRVAAIAPQAPADNAAAPAPVESGGYVVQLAAVRTSEADAQTRFRQLQTKFPMLSGRQPLIRRKDQGERGVFYAAQVGPFGAKSEADQLCGELKSAGGDCYVLRN